MGQTVPLNAATERNADHHIEPLFLKRWSPRAMSSEPLAIEELYRLFEAARWAPSSFNIQPWRFIYGLRGSKSFDDLAAVLVDANQAWASAAGALVAIASLSINPKSGEPAPTHSFDCGAAWMNFALQGSAMGLVVHGMAGFDRQRLQQTIGLPENYVIEAMAAIGYPGQIEELPKAYQENEEPSDRMAIDDFCFAGTFPTDPD